MYTVFVMYFTDWIDICNRRGIRIGKNNKQEFDQDNKLIPDYATTNDNGTLNSDDGGDGDDDYKNCGKSLSKTNKPISFMPAKYCHSKTLDGIKCEFLTYVTRSSNYTHITTISLCNSMSIKRSKFCDSVRKFSYSKLFLRSMRVSQRELYVTSKQGVEMLLSSNNPFFVKCRVYMYYKHTNSLVWLANMMNISNNKVKIPIKEECMQSIIVYTYIDVIILHTAVLTQ